MLDLDACERRARELITFADGLEDGGMTDTARRSRAVARETLELVDAVRSERSARQAAQASYKRCLDLIGARADRDVSEAVNE